MCWLAQCSGLKVGTPLIARWYELAPPVRAHLSSFLAAGEQPGGRIEVTSREPVPASFVEDLAVGGSRLRAAFPDLVRQVSTIEARDGGTISIRVSCEGTHEGAFFGFMLPTRRRVRFEEIHELAVHEDVIADRVSIDIRAIIRQLVSA